MESLFSLHNYLRFTFYFAVAGVAINLLCLTFLSFPQVHERGRGYYALLRTG